MATFERPADGLDVLEDPYSTFELIHPLGRGSYGAVYKARMLQTGDVVAIKIIPLTDPHEIAGIQKEIAMLRECNHPNVVKYYGSWRTPDSLWICMEYCAAGSVADLMYACDAPLPEAAIAYVVSGALEGLAYLHSVGKVHRDIKCGNILLTESGDVKLADFGVAAQLTNTMSKRNTFVGTPHWMAPEVIQLSQYDGKVDVWAMGISAIEMAEQFPPRWRINPNRVIFMIVRDPPPQLADRDRWSLAFQDFVAHCLQKDAKMRPSAQFLQQHRFLPRERSAAAAGILPMVQRARALMAELAVAAAGGGMPMSWDEAGGTVQAAGGRQAMYDGQSLMQQGQPPLRGLRGYNATVLASGGGPQPPTPGARQRNEAAGVPGTMVVRSPLDISSPMRMASPGLGVPLGATFMPRDVASSPTQQRWVATDEEPESDYLAAVQAVAHRPAELQVHGFGYAGGLHYNRPQSESQRLIERLHNLYSSGAVVPLPFLRAADLPPLALLGTPQEQSAAAAGRPAGEEEEPAAWHHALRDLVEQSTSGAVREVPAAVATQVAASPVLRNLVAGLAYYNEAVAAQAADPAAAPARVRDSLRLRQSELADTLRIILCL